MRWRTIVVSTAFLISVCSTVSAQRPGRGGGAARGGQQPRGLNPQNGVANQGRQRIGNQRFQQNGNQAQQAFGNRGPQAFGNQAGQGMDNAMGFNRNGNNPSAQQLARMMLANFDADGSGELGVAELQNALGALGQMMRGAMDARNGQDVMGNPQNAMLGPGNNQRAVVNNPGARANNLDARPQNLGNGGQRNRPQVPPQVANRNRR